jgi:hypothetical protein
MKDSERRSDGDILGGLLKEALSHEDGDQMTSWRVVSAVMDQVRECGRPARSFAGEALALILLAATSLAWVITRQLAAAVPAFHGLLDEIWWRLGEGALLRLAHGAYAAASGLASLDFGVLFPLLLTATLLILSMVVRGHGSSIEK